MSRNGRRELLILNRTQFGYHVATYYYCRHAASRLRITCVSFDTGRPKFHADGVDVKYVTYRGWRWLRYLRLLSAFAREVRKCRGGVLINYFPGCSVLRCFGSRARMVMDIRTGSVHQNPIVRRWEDRLMRWESRFFRNVTIVSQSLAERLHLPSGKTHILPLGAERMTMPTRQVDRLDLLYVGTFDGRCIEDTVLGVERFLRDSGGRIPLTYTIVGNGRNGQLEKLRRLVRGRGLDHIVHLPGFVHRTQLNDTFGRCSVGVAYVPINDIYDCQPVTKTYEYLFAGMPVIATATTENRKVVNRLNGVLIQDTPEGFCRGLREVYARRHQFDSEKIQLSCSESSWDRIVHENLIPFIHDVCRS